MIGRLSGDHNFANLYRRGRGVFVDSLRLKYLWVSNSPTKVAVVVSKKISTKATQRNLYKRRIWGCLRDNRQLLPTTTCHLVITAQPLIKKLPYAELCQEIIKLLKKIPQ